MGILSAFLSILLGLLSLFMILLVLIQRGRGGGLIGALGGPGGSSALGTRAGDIFTRITIVTACIWFLLAIILVKLHGLAESPYQPQISLPPPGEQAPGLQPPSETPGEGGGESSGATQESAAPADSAAGQPSDNNSN